MKKLLSIGLCIVLLASCKKERGCGVVVGSGSVNCSGSTCTYKLPVKFDDGHWADVSVDEYTWINTLEGERICF